MKNILVIDMQVGFINKKNKKLINKINNYLKENKFDNIFYTKFVNKKKSAFVSILNWKGMQTKKEQEFAVNVLDNSIIFVKKSYGLTPNMIKVLKSKNIDEIEICGTDTDACVMAVAYNLFDNNIKPIILEDLCYSSSKSKNTHKNSIEIMKRSFGSSNIKTSCLKD